MTLLATTVGSTLDLERTLKVWEGPVVMYAIGKVAAQSWFSTSALRYSAERGVLTPVRRTTAGYRIYVRRY